MCVCGTVGQIFMHMIKCVCNEKKNTEKFLFPFGRQKFEKKPSYYDDDDDNGNGYLRCKPIFFSGSGHWYEHHHKHRNKKI